MTDASTTGNRDVERSATVTVRYWAAARAAAGREVDHVAPGSVADVLDAVRALHDGNERFMRVLEICSVLVGEEPLGGADPTGVTVPAGGQLELLPPFAGGARETHQNLSVGGHGRRAET
ncbi:MoaD/ThiS family protein [Mumia zhuanghuii]|uniref:MoaD/ThiS family protein n=1 Tax=Mumia zhuanghuii TaxID=2585211 RepID=A0A5C4MGM7_9ACTN|nr:MoaD/ThiS family protein [Mumia zhuanghuii]TNC37495.1 MoaD/ThiS family protein [Mumia zhuanghuii]TNC44178.1 MoaD/ThiS family protein [Mumia zhuanghuii]